MEFLLPIIILLNLSYLYYWCIVIWARAHKHIDSSTINNREIRKALASSLQHNYPHEFVIQITTKGGNSAVVKRGIRYALLTVRKYPVLRKLLVIEVITEVQAEVDEINRLFRRAAVPVTAYCLPAAYETTNGTKLKARALQYMVEIHRQNPRDAYIVHYDEESVFTPDNLARLIRTLLLRPMGISEGPISYPLEWSDAHRLCRTMESNRPFGCHECYLVMTHPAPLHLHGSNLVILERLENEIGWDMGQFNNQPMIAEDLVFGLMAYIKYGGAVFGWHGVEMLEQPPFTLKAARKQRERWVMGALQGVSFVPSLPGWRDLSVYQRCKIQGIIRLRIFTYAVGFPISLISLASWTLVLAGNLLLWSLTGQLSVHLSWLALPGLVMWLGGTQLGLQQNLSYTTMNFSQKLWEHLIVLINTPLAGLYDTAGPLTAVLKWTFGIRGIKWVPTPKQVGQEIDEPIAA
jgi:beta-1,4-mannosyltransferase